ncbi:MULTISPECIES: LysR family transcriptional regulator [Caballeronia]|jgi:DNA-binding transcriptional LysR family regulator|uniref:LysR family transcriptional regulator n=1 Tax=Caballeronia zhejiangensis TaxID=871203 RepID=A0A656QQJ2_9BURK|nr:MULTISPECIES: LysR family transcriptional regulator [Caballeronia]EKS69704.1 LysR family transcriptional regulator [Burkholderia sp. SJ98]KDR32565.1 LysR family transcriptional regulator [Caballeronia zhejiangensis]MCG7401110.1 LysR family transcriptional regulator [Caballeronia zhejiangensis]MCI1044403.1 LysR family transcriptional regulator [Caballeronia zhejiangensis]MDR5767296.1 LysR family transcriptional regulator [Caballeronia sp. LZ028]
MTNTLRRLDLNLLLTLDVLLAEQNVTRAAERLHFSQPSVSVHLSKLRDIFGDPLLLPGPRGMRPTARAESLREPLREALASLERAVSPEAAFDPAIADNTWRIAATDYSESTVLLPALSGLRAAAPHTRIAVLEMLPPRLAKQAENGEIDLAFHITSPEMANFHQQALFTESYVLVGRKDHPRLKRRPTLAQFCALEHVIVSPDGGGFFGPTDDTLATFGMKRHVALSVPHFLFVRSVLATTDLVSMQPARLAKRWPELRIVAPPVDVPGYEMSMYWHERVHRDPAHRWLREFIAQAV